MSLHPMPQHLVVKSHQPHDNEPLLSYADAAKRLGVTARTVWTLVDSGELPNVRFGRSVRIDPADLRVFINKSKSTHQPHAHQQQHQPGGDR